MKTVKFENKNYYVNDEWVKWDEHTLIKEISNVPIFTNTYRGIILYYRCWDDIGYAWIVNFTGVKLEYIYYLYTLYIKLHNTHPYFSNLESAKLHADQFLDRSIKLQYFM